MKRHPVFSLILAFALLGLWGAVAMAQTPTPTPDVQVSDDGIVDDAVLVTRATVTGPAWVVIHADDNGQPGPVIGQAPLTAGENMTVTVPVDTAAATPILHAMLHVDAGTMGDFEFPGPDTPVRIGDDIVMARFSAAPPVAAAQAAPAALPTTGGGPATPVTLAVVAVLLAGLGAGVAVSRRHA